MSRPLDAKRVYYQLTRRSARLLALPLDVTTPLGRTAVLRRYAWQWFMELETFADQRWICHPQDHPDFFGNHAERLPMANHFFEERQETSYIGVTLIDHGSDLQRDVRRAIKIIERHVTLGCLGELMAADRFLVVLLTLTQEKADALPLAVHAGLQKRLLVPLRRVTGKREDFVRIETHVVPQAIQLI